MAPLELKERRLTLPFSIRCICTLSSEGSTAPQDVIPQPQPQVQALPRPEPTFSTPASTSPVRQLTAVGMGLPVIVNGYHIPVTGFHTTMPNSTSLPCSIQMSNVPGAQQTHNRLLHQLPPTTGSIFSHVPAQSSPMSTVSTMTGFKFDRYTRLSKGYPWTGSTKQLCCSQAAPPRFFPAHGIIRRIQQRIHL